MSKLPILLLTCSILLVPAAAMARDRDRDGLRDRWERKHDLSLKKKSGKGDPDRDRLSNRREFKRHTNPRRRDTDRDGLRDRAEIIRHGTNPRRRDSDGDGLRDRAELRRYKTHPRRRDTDGDGYSDRAEIRAGTDPRNPQSHPGSTSAPASVAPAAPGGRPGPPANPGPRPVALACSRTATTATFGAQVAAAAAGETVCLASGDYGTWGGTNKPITVGPAPGAAVSMGISFGSGDGGFTLAGVDLAGRHGPERGAELRGPGHRVHRCGRLQRAGEREHRVRPQQPQQHQFGSGQLPGAHPPSRIGGSTPSGVTISNSLLAGGDSDGVQSGIGVNVVNNEFRDIREAGGQQPHRQHPAARRDRRGHPRKLGPTPAAGRRRASPPTTACDRP